MPALLITLAFVTGMALALQPVINADVARRMGHPILGALISVTITFAALLATTLALRVPLPSPRDLVSLPPPLFVGGLIGAVFLFASLYLAPRLGVAVSFAVLIAGQLVAALLIDQTGFLGIARQEITPVRLLGIGFLILGVILVRRA